jgi:cell division protein FtsB
MKISVTKAVYTLIVLSGMSYAFITLQGPNGIPGLRARQASIKEYERENQKLQKEIDDEQKRIERLQTNSTEQEFEIRQRLKLAKPGEKIYILDDSHPGNKK